jgi:pimeloyl-ACP methyl ester carboxylesterase/DNA-binding SARP family transcriptional activator
MQCDLRLFGPPSVVRDDRVEPIRLKRCALLLALLVAEPSGVGKEILAERLWSDGDDKARRSRLRRLVFELRAQLGEAALTEDQGRLQLAPPWLARCDLHAFLDTHAKAVHEDRIDDVDAAAGVVTLARQSLLGALQFDDPCAATEWLDYQRVAHAGMCRRLRECVVDKLMAAGDTEAALALLLQDLPGDPFDDTAAELAARLLYRGGRFAECIAMFQTLRRNLASELGLDAAPSFHTLAADATARLAAASVWNVERPVTRYVASGDAHIAYQVFGEGPRDLLVIPGFVSSVEMAWDLPQLSEFLARLAPQFRVILFDRRGIGLSDRLPQDGAANHAVADIVAVLDAAGSQSTLVFAASEGGPLGIRLASEHPRRVAGLCLFGALPKGSAEGDFRAALTREQYAHWLADMVATWGTPAALHTFCPSHAEDPVMREWWSRLLRLSSSPASLAAILEQLRDMDVIPLLGGLACPVTLIHRTGDRAVHIAASRYMAARIPGARMVELDGNDHFWWMADNDVVLAELQRLA